MAKAEYISCLPDERIKQDALRNLGYNWDEALAEFVDNSIDAGAKRIDVRLNEPPKSGNVILLNHRYDSIEVVDNGIGMTRERLEDGMKFGSVAKAALVRPQLGLYGMGMLTGGVAVGRRVAVTTRASGDKTWYAAFDIDTTAESTGGVPWAIELRRATALEENALKEAVRQLAPFEFDEAKWHGTLIEISKLDRFHHRSVDGKLGRILLRKFRSYLRGIGVSVTGEPLPLPKVQISVNGVVLNAARRAPTKSDSFVIDPIADLKSEVTFDSALYVRTAPDGRVTHDVSSITDINQRKRVLNVLTAFPGVRFIFYQMDPSDPETKLTIGRRSCGFYVLREQREIMDNEALGAFNITHHYGLFRALMVFRKQQDLVVQASFTKNDLALTEVQKQALRELISPYLTQAERRNERTSKPVPPNEKESLDALTKAIEERASVAMLPRVSKETRSPRQPKGGTSNAPGGTRERMFSKAQAVQRMNDFVIFEAAQMGRYGDVYAVEKRVFGAKDKMVIVMNTDHPFYDAAFRPAMAKHDMMVALGILIYSQAVLHYNVEDGSPQKVWSEESLSTMSATAARMLARLEPDKVDEFATEESA